MPDLLDHTVLSERYHVEHYEFVAFALESILNTRDYDALRRWLDR